MALAVLSFHAQAQSVTRLALKQANATHPEEFSSVPSVRELSDGRVLVADARDKRLLVLDFAKGTAVPIGREGAGPSEYRQLTTLLRAAGDTTLMMDAANRRLLILSGAQIVGTTPPDAAMIRSAGSQLFGADAQGNVLARRSAIPNLENAASGRQDFGREDSSFVIVVRRSDGKADTIAKALNAPRSMEIVRDPKGAITRVDITIRDPMATEEQAILLPDGVIAVARLDPFRVDWRSADGRWSMGSALPDPHVRVDQRERDAFHQRQLKNFVPRPGATAPAPLPAEWFPAFVPPFLTGGALRAGPGGTVLIRRAPSADLTGNRYYVMDRRRGLRGEIVLPEARTIVGAGAATLYVAVKDEDDILHLERIPWP